MKDKETQNLEELLEELKEAHKEQEKALEALCNELLRSMRTNLFSKQIRNN